MKNIFLMAFFLSAMALFVSAENHSGYGPRTLMVALQNLLVDPQYLALSDYEQLAVLEVLYSIMEASYNQRMKEKSKKAKREIFSF